MEQGWKLKAEHQYANCLFQFQIPLNAKQVSWFIFVSSVYVFDRQSTSGIDATLHLQGTRSHDQELKLCLSICFYILPFLCLMTIHISVSVFPYEKYTCLTNQQRLINTQINGLRKLMDT